MAKIESWFNCDLKKAVQAQALNGNVFSLDNNGNRIGVRIFDGGQKATVSGTVTGRCILADGSTVNVNGSLSTADGQSIAYLDIPQGCLLIPGTLRISMQLTASGVITTLLAIVTNVYQTKTDNVITPSAQVIADWNAQISAAIQNQDATIASAVATQNAQISDLKSAFNSYAYYNLSDSVASKRPTPVKLLPGTKITFSNSDGTNIRSGTVVYLWNAAQGEIDHFSIGGNANITITCQSKPGIDDVVAYLSYQQTPVEGTTKIMVNIGDTALPYLPYAESVQDKIDTIDDKIKYLAKWAALVPYNSQYQVPAMQFSTTNKTVTIKRSIVLADQNKQYSMGADASVSYDVSGTTNVYIVFDTDDSTVKAVAKTAFVASHHLILAVLDKSYVAYTYQVATFNSYNVDGVYYPLNKALEQSPGSKTTTAISQDGATKCFGMKYSVLIPQTDKYAIFIDKTNNKFIIKKCYLFEKTGRRKDFSTDQEISATVSPATIGTKYLVYDESNSTIKVVETSISGNNKFDQKIHSVILAFGGDNGLDNVVSLTPYTYVGGSVSSDEPVQITVANYNVGNYNKGSPRSEGNPPSLDTIAPKLNTVLNKMNVDILGVEEDVSTIDNKSVDAYTYANIYKSIYRPTGIYSIKSKHAFKSQEKVSFTATQNSYLHCVCTIGERDVDIFCTDLDAHSETRAIERAELITLLSSCDYGVALIDANAGNDTPQTTQDEYDDFIEAGLNTANGGFLGLIKTYPGPEGTSNGKLDTVVTTSNIMISGIYAPDVYSDMYSDHIPLVCQLTIY